MKLVRSSKEAFVSLGYQGEIFNLCTYSSSDNP